MKLENFVKLHRDCGLTIHKVQGYYFYSHWIKEELCRKSSSFPQNYQISINRKLVNALKWRFLVSPILINSKRKDVFEFVLTTDNYGLDRFDKKVRNRIRKSLQTCKIIRPTLEDLLRDGLIINQQSCERQNRNDNLITDPKLWKKYITSIYNNNDFLIWGAYFEEKLSGYLIVYELEGKFNILQALINRENSSVANPMCGLIYTAVNSLIKEHGQITISYGIHKLKGPTPLNKFKQNMLFEIEHLSRAYVINPVFLLFTKLTVFVTIKILHRKSIRYKCFKSILRLYQGHRRLITELNRIQNPDSINYSFHVSDSLDKSYTNLQSI